VSLDRIEGWLGFSLHRSSTDLADESLGGVSESRRLRVVQQGLEVQSSVEARGVSFRTRRSSTGNQESAVHSSFDPARETVIRGGAVVLNVI
jgi:hypothetical protein